VPSLEGNVKLENSFLVQSNAPAGSITANLTAVSDTRGNTVQLIGKDQQQIQNGGIHPWSIRDGNSSTLLLFNPSQTTQHFDVRVAAAGVLWMQSYDLLPYETKALEIQNLIAAQQKDKNGKVLPKEVNAGQVSWSTSGAGQGSGRMLVSRPDISLARNFSCSIQEVGCGLDMSNSALDLLIETNGQLGPVIASYCTTGSLANDCSGDFDYSQQYSGSDWESDNTAIATTDPNSGSMGNVYGQGGGTAQITASGYVYGCFFAGSGSAYVQVPTALVGPTLGPFSSYSNQPLYSCNSQLLANNFYGIAACGQYIVLDQEDQQINQTGLAFDETLTLSDYNHAYVYPDKPYSGSGATDANFHLLDFYSDGGIGGPLPSDYYRYWIQQIIYHPTGSVVRTNCLGDLVTTISVANIGTNPGFSCHH